MFLAPVTPMQLVQLSFQLGAIMAEAQMVIAMRMLGMAGMWRTAPMEPVRMVGEKLAAAQEAASAVKRAALAGHSPAVMADQALQPIRRRTRANVKRLARRGPSAGTPNPR